MIKSYAVMESVTEVCSKLRAAYFGKNAMPADYKDSYVINKTIEEFGKASPEELMSDSISDKDREKKVSKSINFRSDCYLKVNALSELLKIPESEVTRRIMYYSLEQKSSGNSEAADIPLSMLKTEVMLLKSQLLAGLETLEKIENSIKKIEVK